MSINYMSAVEDSIPRDRPVIMFLLDDESCEFVTWSSDVDIVDTHQGTIAAIKEKSSKKFNDFLYTTDLASARWNLLDAFVVGFLRAGWGGHSIESSYYWMEDDGEPLVRFTCAAPEMDKTLLNQVLDGEVFG
jgi:hypothetical protein